MIKEDARIIILLYLNNLYILTRAYAEIISVATTMVKLLTAWGLTLVGVDAIGEITNHDSKKNDCLLFNFTKQ